MINIKLLEQNIILIQRTLNSLQNDSELLEIKDILKNIKLWLIDNFNKINPSDQLLLQFVDKLNDQLNTWDLSPSIYFELVLNKSKLPNYIVSRGSMNYNSNTIQIQLDYDLINKMFKQKNNSDRYIKKIINDILQIIVHQYSHYDNFKHVRNAPYQKKKYIINNMWKKQQNYKNNHDANKIQHLAYATQVIHRLKEQGYTNSEIINMIKTGQIFKKSLLLKGIKNYSKETNDNKILKSILMYIYQMLNNKKENINESYDPPMSTKQIVKNNKQQLLNDPIHKWRAQTGIQLIHKQPTLEQLNRIYKNWLLMSDQMKAKSDKKSMQLFSLINIDHYKKLKREYK